MIQLHYYPSSASMVPHLLLEEIGQSFDLILVDRAGGAHKAAPYLRLSPNGLLPVPTAGELVLYETAAICLHLCDTHPQARLAPALGSSERAQFYKWLIWLTNTLQSTLILYFYPGRWVNAGNTSGAEEVKSYAQQRIDLLLNQLDDELAGHSGPWLLGETYSALDPYVFTLCRWTRHFDIRPARDKPQLGPYLQRLLARPAVQRTLAAEQLSPPSI